MCKAGMKRRSQKVEILLDIQSVRSPDAWVPCNGAIYLSICLLGQYIRTKDKAPIFPINFNETFVVEKVFGHVFRLADLDDMLDAEVVYLELIQRPPAGPDTVLASFETSARELLFPRAAAADRPARADADLDLIMEPTAHFVGSVAPRLEVATKTTVREVRTSLPPRLGGRTGTAAARAATAGQAAAVAVPKVLRGRPAGDRPPFRWRRPETALIGREIGDPPPPTRRRRRSRSDPPAGAGRGRHCHCSCSGQPAAARPARSTSSAERAPTSSSGGRAVRSRSVEPLPVQVDEGAPPRAGWCAHCQTHHIIHHCSVCEAYQRYFGRGYPGHYHHDCCDCRCPVTTDGVRHVCGKPRSGGSDGTDSEVMSQDSGHLAQEWQDIVRASPQQRTQRHRFYDELEDVYRRMYASAARRAVRGLVS
ncbi:Spermatogenesis-associated protein 6 [Amphibalanus amphitrite]|uniref:Spermatogenesis-associated protein 6 n=1 Tax=Amphibalanus amphitrite TaxID=1232801 RepID=A0A6A4WPB6_AMPAM|nr:Spermatogenesis-associated protein 6 [Amphibalanus amphitrite]